MKKILTSNGKPISFIFKIKLLVLALVFTQCKNKVVELPPTQNFSQERISTLQSFVDQMMKNYPIPGLIVSMVHQDSVYYTSSGVKNSKNELLATSTPILVGAISEPLLADAVLKLANSGRIDLDDKVVKHLPYFTMGGNAYGKITIRNLLTHTSGIDHYNLMWDMPNFSPNATEVTTRSIATQHPKWDQPGTHVLRSPYNYDILADLVSKVTHKPFEDYIRDKVFAPLEMNNTRFYKVKNSAMPFVITDWLKYTYKQNNSYPYNREHGGSGGLHTSAQDLTKWMYQLLNQSQDINKQYFEVQFNTGDKSAVGYGWDVYNDGKHDIYTKGSQYGGFTQQIILIPSKKIGVVAVCNISGDFNPTNMVRDISQWLSTDNKIDVKIPVSIMMTKELARTGKIENSFKIYHKLKETHPGKYDFRVRILEQFGVNLLHRVNDKKNAIKAFEFCADQYPLSSGVYLNLAESFILNKDVKNAKIAIKKAQELSDDTGMRESSLAYLNEKIEIIEEKQVL